MNMGICPINEIYNAGTIPHGQRFLAAQLPMDRGSQMDFTLNDHGEMSDFNFRGTVAGDGAIQHHQDDHPVP